MANGYSRLKRIGTGTGHRSGNEEGPVLADLHLHKRFEDELLPLKRTLNGLRKGDAGQAARLNVAKQGKRYRAAVVDHDLQRIGGLAEHGYAQHVAGVESVSVGARRIRGKQDKGHGEEAANDREQRAGREVKLAAQPRSAIFPGEGHRHQLQIKTSIHRSYSG